MVLFELGEKISNALKKMSNNLVLNDEALTNCLNEIGMALLLSDVSLQ